MYIIQIIHTYTCTFPCNTLSDIRHQKEGRCKGPNFIDLRKKNLSFLCTEPVFLKATSRRHLLFKFEVKSD